MGEPTEEEITAAAREIMQQAASIMPSQDFCRMLARRALVAAYAATPKPDTDEADFDIPADGEELRWIAEGNEPRRSAGQRLETDNHRD